MDNSHLPFCATQNIVVLAFECGTSNDGIFFPIFCLLRHPVTQIAQPWVRSKFLVTSKDLVL